MSQGNAFTVDSIIKLCFPSIKLRDFAYNTFLPEMRKTKSSRSRVSLQKGENDLVFTIQSTDITAFRASVSDVIGLGKIIESTITLCE